MGFKEKFQDAAGEETGRQLPGLVAKGLLVGADALGKYKTAKAREKAAAAEAAAFNSKVKGFMLLLLMIAGIGTGGLLLVKKLFFSQPNTVVESMAVVEVAPKAVPEVKTKKQDTKTAAPASESKPAAKTGFFHKIGRFFAGIGAAIKGFFIMAWNGIKTFFINIGGFFSGIFGKIGSFFRGLFNK